ncbi:MAG: ADP-ribosylglycohydrolase family protein [Clostridia bacterium]|nr:ADP-ribosylglycohydrolase family protein [Clostridia bacterium]
MGALAVALAAHMSSMHPIIEPHYFLHELNVLIENIPKKKDFLDLIRKVVEYIKPIEDYMNAHSMTKGVTGYSYHTVPVVLFLLFKYQKDFAAAIKSVIRCGGDTDTTAAILGGIIGSGTGLQVYRHTISIIFVTGHTPSNI